MLLLNCIVTITLSSFLLFFIQPLVAKQILPLFGGVPAVWNICLVFFQGMLLLSYLYVFMSTTYLKAFTQRTLHLTLIIGSLLCLPFLTANMHLEKIVNPAYDVLLLLLNKLALPLFILGTTSSLIQYWFCQTNHPHAKDPYFLYSASNVGGLIALLTFPFIFEPIFGLHKLSINWAVVYVLFTIGVILTCLLCKYNYNDASIRNINESSSKVNNMQRLQWVLLSFAPASLLVGVTQYITTDIASAPLLWILPLTLYLLTFIIAFSRKPIISHQWILREQSFLLIFPLLTLIKTSPHTLSTVELIAFPLFGFFVLALVCQGELVAKRPDKTHLPEFYLWIACGGFLGSIFNSILSPVIFNGIYEYFIAFCLCILLRPWPKTNGHYQWSKSDFLVPLFIAWLLLIPLLFSNLINISRWEFWIQVGVITILVTWDKRPFRFAVSLALLFIFLQFTSSFAYGNLLLQSRDFFGVTKIYNDPRANFHILFSGSTIHGIQSFKKSNDVNTALTYYAPMKSIANLIDKKNSPKRVGIAGLGAGTLSCIFNNSKVTFFEIDPTMIKLASESQYFTYLKNCPPEQILLGDARLSFTKIPSHFFNVIIIDAFSSDSIPIHLVTREAITLFLDKLTSDGVLIFHITNRHINLNNVLASLAAQLHLQAYIINAPDLQSETSFNFKSAWIVLTANEINTQMGWKKLTATKHLEWTDDFSNILSILK